ncbi:unnamed protein product [Musa hybrid cultivar]
MSKVTEVSVTEVLPVMDVAVKDHDERALDVRSLGFVQAQHRTWVCSVTRTISKAEMSEGLPVTDGLQKGGPEINVDGLPTWDANVKDLSFLLYDPCRRTPHFAMPCSSNDV